MEKWPKKLVWPLGQMWRSEGVQEKWCVHVDIHLFGYTGFCKTEVSEVGQSALFFSEPHTR